MKTRKSIHPLLSFGAVVALLLMLDPGTSDAQPIPAGTTPEQAQMIRQSREQHQAVRAARDEQADRLRDHEDRVKQVIRNQRAGRSVDPLDATIPLSIRVRHLIDNAGGPLERAAIGVVFHDLQDNARVVDINSKTLLTPASVIKVYTTLVALESWGADHQFSTVVRATQRSGSAVTGDVVLVGGGDAMLTHADLTALARRLYEQAGIRSVAGDIVLDVSRYAAPAKGPGWMWDDEPDYYNMTISPLMMNYNVVWVNVAAGPEGGAPTVTLDPAVAFPPVVLVPVEGATQVSIRRRPFEEPILVEYPATGAYTAARERLSVLSSDQWVGAAFREALVATGISVGGDVRVSRQPVEGTELLRHDGATLRDALRHFNRVSENAIGEVLMLNLATDRTGTPGTWPEGARLFTEHLTTNAGVPVGSFRLVDGSGLSRYNMISGESAIGLLRHGWQGGLRDTFIQTLNTYDVELPPDADGSLSRTRVRAKTGGMGGVTSLIGYVETIEGRQLAFAWLANGFIGPARPIHELRTRTLSAAAAYSPEKERERRDRDRENARQRAEERRAIDTPPELQGPGNRPVRRNQ